MKELAQEISDLYGLIYRNLIRNENDSVEMSSSSKNAVLAVLLRMGPCRMSRIGAVLKVTNPNVTFLVDRLEKDGLLAREKDEQDRRAVVIRLTAKGEAKIKSERKQLLGRIGSRLDDMTAADAERLRAAVETATEVLRALYSDGPEEA